MKRSAAVRAVLITGALFASVLSSAQAATPAVKNVVLVHGAWADGSSWSKVVPLLEAKGLHVTAVQLSLTSLADDVATTRRAIALEDGPVLLVGHSYGGAVITEAGNDPKVAGLVFVAAFAPDAGESALSLLQARPPTPVGTELRPDAAGFFKLTVKGINEDFAQDLPAGERQVLAAAQGPTSGAALTGKISSAAWKTKPTWFVVATEDRVIGAELEKIEADKMHAQIITVHASHVAMLAQPVEVGEFIALAAGGSR